MKGNQELNLKYINLIENSIKNEDPVIRNFSYYISNLSITTRYQYIKNVIRFYNFTRKDPSEIVLNDFSMYLSKIKYTEDGSETTSSYRIEVYSALKKFCKYLFYSDIIENNYMEAVERPKAIESQKTIDKRKISYLNENEIRKYIKNVNEKNNNKEKNPSKRWSFRDRSITKIFLSTGIRCSALVKMDVDDVDFEKKTICVTDKGGKVNEFSLPDNVLDDLKIWMKYRNKMIIEDSNALFISKYRKRMSSNAVSDVVKKYGEDIKHLSPHKLRASYGTLLYEKTGDIHAVQKCMGHKSPNTTQIYIRENSDYYKEKAKNIIEKIL